ncbi:carbon catabolite repressor protein 4 homolog 3-like isoform X5 [Humulus lupulus]|uniref:carbon catabolite repressor protein 4 homolog 3-like isoform X5 n=1 Tax=Humulus lupulus TaxID=3486 RepID=UPI002B400709|nr:carbon catabolite repressor protein 4 homolog 3-like isoform X5 [Humulus lupulus]
MVHGVCEAILIKRLREELKIKYEAPIQLHYDNQSTISIAHNPVHHDRTKHVEVDHHFIKEKIDGGVIKIEQMCKDASRRLLIGNIHVLYNPSPGDVKLGQIHFLSSRAHVLSEKWGNVPVLLTGDFNSTPQSAIYKFMSSSELNVKLYDRRELSGQRSCHPAQVLGVKQEISSPLSLIDGLLKTSWKDEEIKVATGNSEGHVVVHSLNLNSSYATVKSYTGTREPNGEPLATSYHSKFLGTVDYIWYSDDLLPTRVLDTVSVDILMTTGGLPCQVRIHKENHAA